MNTPASMNHGLRRTAAATLLALAGMGASAQGLVPGSGSTAPVAAPPASAATPAFQDLYGGPTHDPLEPINRGVYRFNDTLDRAVFKPVATVYRDYVPGLLRTGVSNFFGNLGDVWSLANNALQLKPQGTAETVMRLGVNTLFGLGGLLDIASEAGIERHSEDFGQTLGYWGVPAGPYVVLPLFGPSTVRDTAALPVDRWGAPLGHVNDIPVRNSLTALALVDTRANLLTASRLLEDAALDPYTFMRDSYLQRRSIEVRDVGPGDDTEERYDLE